MKKNDYYTISIKHICQIAIVHFKVKICLSINWGQLVPSCRSGVTCREYFLSHCLLKWSARFLHSPDPPALRRATGEYIEHGVWFSMHVASGDACPEVLSLALGVLGVNPAKYWSHPDEFLSFWHLWSTSFSFASLWSVLWHRCWPCGRVGGMMQSLSQPRR